MKNLTGSDNQMDNYRSPLGRHLSCAATLGRIHNNGRGGEEKQRDREEAAGRRWRGRDGRREKWKQAAEGKEGVNEGGRGEGKEENGKEERGEGIRGETSKQAATWRGEEGRTAGGNWGEGEKR